MILNDHLCPDKSRKACACAVVGFGRYWIISVCLAALSALSASSQIANTNPVVTAREFMHLTHEQVSGSRPVRISGVVVCYDSGWNQLYVYDGQNTAYFNPHLFHPEPAIGQFVEVTGTTTGDSTLLDANVSILHQSPVPAAKPLSLAQLANYHGEWIETSGRVLSADTSLGRLALLLHEDGAPNCVSYVMGPPPNSDYKRLRDSLVRVRGINASKAVDGRLESASIFVPAFNEVTVLQPPGPSPRQTPVVSIGSLLNRELGSWTNSMVHLNGLIASYQPGQSLVVKDPTGVIRARVVQLSPAKADERVEVWGYLNVSANETLLNDAFFEIAPPRQTDAVATVGAQPGDSSRLPAALTQISDILKLKRDEAARQIPVKLQGVITFADPDWHNVYLQDKGGAIYVDSNQRDLKSGQWVELTGRTSPGGFAPEVLSSSVVVVGLTNLPMPAKVDLDDMANGHLDAHWVEMDGVVRRVDLEYGHVNLSVMTPNGRFKVIIPGFENKPAPGDLIDALISVQGACNSELNSRGQLSGITLHAPGLEQVRVLESPAADPFSIEATRIEAIATFDPNRLAGRRIKVSGEVTLRIPGQGFIIQDASGGVRVLTRQTNEVHIGDTVDALGFPVLGNALGFPVFGDFSPYLEEAAFRQTGTAPQPAPKQTSAEQILLQGTTDGQLVEINGRLLQSVPRSANPQLVLQDGPVIFLAHLEMQGKRTEVPAFESGSLLQLTGVCSIQGGEGHEPATFRLLLRQPADIAVLETPPWWTARHAFMLAGGMALAIALALAWVALLRRQVQTQTNLIRQKLEDEAALEKRYLDLFENANDMVYTHDLSGRITSINKTGEQILQRRRAELLDKNILDFVAPEQRAAAQQWLDQVVKGAPPPTVEWDFASATGQRLKVEISTRLIKTDGRLTEVEGIARDITERKRLEREILDISNREQRRIGHDLHDGVCQQLAGIAFMAESLTDRLQENNVSESTQAERITRLLNTVIHQTRGVARGLFPVRLEENGLASALEEFASNASELFKINCRFVCEEPPGAVDNEVALHLYYIVLEAVANASKHGKARHVTITLEPVKDRYALSVRDDGCGFETGRGSQTGMGIRIMHYRARVIGAILTLQSHPGSGTHVACLFQPVSRELVSIVENRAS